MSPEAKLHNDNLERAEFRDLIHEAIQARLDKMQWEDIIAELELAKVFFATWVFNERLEKEKGQKDEKGNQG